MYKLAKVKIDNYKIIEYKHKFLFKIKTLKKDGQNFAVLFVKSYNIYIILYSLIVYSYILNMHNVKANLKNIGINKKIFKNIAGYIVKNNIILNIINYKTKIDLEDKNIFNVKIEDKNKMLKDAITIFIKKRNFLKFINNLNKKEENKLIKKINKDIKEKLKLQPLFL